LSYRCKVVTVGTLTGFASPGKLLPQSPERDNGPDRLNDDKRP